MRSLLFVPGDDARKLAKGAGSGADVLIFDLEDSVAPAEKSNARAATTRQLRDGVRPSNQGWWVRVNGLATGLTLDDLAAVLPAGPDGIVVPKCRGPDDVRRVSDWLDAAEVCLGRDRGSTRIIAISTETAASVLSLGQYASCHLPRLRGLMWGAEDLSADIGGASRDMTGRYRSVPRLARDLCLLAASAAGVLAIDAVNTNLTNLEDLATEAGEAARDGFSAKAAIHPKQIPLINQAFLPSEADVAWARRVLAALTPGGIGVGKLDDTMIDWAHRRSAERILCRAGESIAEAGRAEPGHLE